MTTKTQRMILGDEKKHSVRYEEVGDPKESDSEALRNSLTGTIYVRKTQLPRPFPKAMTLTLTWED